MTDERLACDDAPHARDAGENDMIDWRRQCHRYSTRLYGPSPQNIPLSWIGDQRIAVGGLPTAFTLPTLAQDGVTHIVNCRSAAQTWVSQDLAVERALLGPSRVVHAPMWDSGYPQPPHLWSAAALFAARVLTNDAAARVLIHCHQGRSRSVMLTYAVLRLRGHNPDQATDLIRCHRVQARMVDTYTGSVEEWLAAGANPVGPLRIR
jgi:protein-tyrosine phosphatase